jgi:hypothetical protein
MFTTQKLTTLLAAILLLSACSSTRIILDQHQDELRNARTISAHFFQTYGQQTNLKDVPFVTLGIEGGTGYSYDENHNVLFITPFLEADTDTKRAFAKASSQLEAPDYYNNLLFEFFTAHQMMHLLYDVQPLAPVSLYEEELRINAMTWLYLNQHGLTSEEKTTQQLAFLQQLETRLVSRFPGMESSKRLASALEVVNSASYWYVTAVSVQQAHQIAGTAGSLDQYLQSLKGNQQVASSH